MSRVTRTRSRSALSVIVSVVLAACGGDDGSRDADASITTGQGDTSWFEVAAVTAVHDAPCAADATPSRDGLHCFELEDAVFDAAGVEEATVVEDLAPECEIPPGEYVCVAATGPTTSTTAQPGSATWRVRFTVTDSALLAFNGLAESCTQLAPACPTGQVAIVVEREVIVAPEVHTSDFERDAFVISGEFDRSTAARIAERLSA